MANEELESKDSKHKYSTFALVFLLFIVVVSVSVSSLDGTGTSNYLAKFLSGGRVVNSNLIDDLNYTLNLSSLVDGSSSQIVLNDITTDLITSQTDTNPANCIDTFINGTKACSFASGSLNQVYTSIQLEDEYVTNTPIQCSIYWAPSDVEVSNVTWNIEYTIADTYE